MSLDNGVARARERFAAAEPARDAALRASRAAVRAASSAIRAAHQGIEPAAREGAAKARSLAQECREALAGFPELLHAGYVHDAEKEAYEAEFVVAVLFGGGEPAAGGDGVSVNAWLHGACEAASELRRDVLDAVRSGQAGRAEALFSWMESAYGGLATIDAPDAMTAGLRRALDSLRAVLERTRGDLAVAATATRLAGQLEKAQEALGAGGGFEPPTSGL